MHKITDKTAFAALAGDKKVRLSFSGKRFYRLCNVCVDSEAIEAELVPTYSEEVDSHGFSGDDIVHTELDISYSSWLYDNGMNDPVWDEVLMPYYKSRIRLPPKDEIHDIDLVVEFVRPGRFPVFRIARKCK